MFREKRTVNIIPRCLKFINELWDKKSGVAATAQLFQFMWRRIKKKKNGKNEKHIPI